MIGKPKWFRLRRYGGWGLTPKTKEGYIYLTLLAVWTVGGLSVISHDLQKIVFLAVTFLVLFLDLFHIMANIRLSKKQFRVESISERNASWAMVWVLILFMFIEAYLSVDDGGIRIHPALVTTLVVGAVVKTITHYLESRKD